MRIERLSDENRRVLRERMRTPFRAFVALLGLLGVIVLLGALLPFRWSWVIEAAAVSMVAVVLLFSMEVIKEPPLTRLFAFAGFGWVAVLLGVTVLDYFTR